MKTMTCRQLGGACDMEFTADSFEEISNKSQAHGREMFGKNDPDHLKAMKYMSRLMESPEAMQTWMDNKRKEFNDLPDV